jgi:hypothetical protein
MLSLPSRAPAHGGEAIPFASTAAASAVFTFAAPSTRRDRMSNREDRMIPFRTRSAVFSIFFIRHSPFPFAADCA